MSTNEVRWLFALIVCGGLIGCGGSGPAVLYAITSPTNEAEDVPVPVAFAGTGPASHNTTTGPNLWVAEYDEEGENITGTASFEITVDSNGDWSKSVSGLDGALLHAACVGTEAAAEIALTAYENEESYAGPAEVSTPIKFTTASVE